MWWEILKNTSFTDKEYRHKIDGYNMFTLMFSDSKPSWMEVNAENNIPYTVFHHLMMNNDFQNKLNALFKFKKGSFALRFDGVTTYVKLEEQENLHHFILEIDFMNTTPRFEAYAKEHGLESKYKFEVNFIKERSESTNKPSGEPLLIKEFVNFEYYDFEQYAREVGEERKEWFKKELIGWIKVSMGVLPAKDEVFEIYKKALRNLSQKANPHDEYYQRKFEDVWQKVKGGI